ncbi:MAG: zinc-ribbon domain-containing protein [Asticcacaulis sp.]|nr:zinc-ribbon domain-containing protein [Asticcacaulis sp.]
MVLTCPSCSTRYTLQDSQMPRGGRTVRCAACKTTWHADKPEDPIELPLAPEPAPARPEELQAVKAKKLPGRYRAMMEDKKRLKALTAQGIVWAALGATALIVLIVGFFLRVDIVRAFPRVAGAYAMVGLPVNASGLTLVSGDGDSKAAFKNGRFVVTVTAKVTNLRNKPTAIPPIKVKLLDGTLQQFDYVVIPSNGLVVEPHATRTLTFDVRDPKNLVAHLDLDFDLEGMKKSKSGAALRRQPADSHEGAEPETTPADAAPAGDTGHAEIAPGSEPDPLPVPANEHTNDIADTQTEPDHDGPALREHHS